MAPGLCSIIKIEEVRDPLLEAPEKVSESLVLFCQGQGLLPTINRRASRQSSQNNEGARWVFALNVFYSDSWLMTVHHHHSPPS